MRLWAAKYLHSIEKVWKAPNTLSKAEKKWIGPQPIGSLTAKQLHCIIIATDGSVKKGPGWRRHQPAHKNRNPVHGIDQITALHMSEISRKMALPTVSAVIMSAPNQTRSYIKRKFCPRVDRFCVFGSWVLVLIIMRSIRSRSRFRATDQLQTVLRAFFVLSGSQ